MQQKGWFCFTGMTKPQVAAILFIQELSIKLMAAHATINVDLLLWFFNNEGGSLALVLWHFFSIH